MHRFDPELVAALAEGTLEAAEAGALEAQIAADPAALADLAKQRAALAAIRTAGSPRLEDLERTTLRAAIAEQLGLAAADSPAAAPTRRVAWGAIAVAASALVAIVAFAPVVGLLSTGGSDDAGDLTFGDDATLVADEADAPLGASLPPGDDMETEAITTTAPATVATGNNEFTPAAVETGGVERSAADRLSVADDLALLKGDPEALQVLGMPVDETTACLAEATELLGSAELLFFEYPAPAEDPARAPIVYVVFHLPAADGAEPGTLLAFSPDDCVTPIAIP